MALRTLTVAFAILLAASNTAYAKHYEHDSDNPAPTRGYKHGYQNLQPITLRLRTRLNGNSTVHLRRMIEDRYRINTQDYRIRSVSIRNKARHNAAANLRTGRHSTGVVGLRRGVTTIAAPHARGPHARENDRWILDVESARVRGITVVLEPKRQRYSHRGDHSYGYSRKHYNYNNRHHDRSYGNHSWYRQWRRY